LLKFSTIDPFSSDNLDIHAMSTVNFSVPEEVKQAFNETFKGCNKSAIIADMMMEAVERAERRKRSKAALDRIMERRAHAPTATARQIRDARDAGRT
jgi:citrate lyase gamma subunit